MKRYTLILTVLFAIMSCNSKVNPDMAGNIVVTATVNGLTKVGYEDGNLPTKFVMSVDQNAASKYDYFVEMTKTATGNIYSAAETLLWASSDHKDVNIKAMTLPYGLTTLDKVDPMTVSVSLDQSLEAGLVASDLLGASTVDGVTIDGNNVKVAFNHLMSKLQVSYDFGPEFGNGPTVKSVMLKDICTTGGYNLSTMDYDSSIGTALGNVVMYHDASSQTAEAIFYPYDPSVNPTLAMCVVISGVEYELTCPVVKSNGAFQGGRRYKLKVSIAGSSIGGASASIISGWDTETEDKDFVTE